MVYVTSDLHGCNLTEFQLLLKKAGFTSDDFLFILGDVIDRGPHGIEWLLWLLEQTNVQLILGNHEALMLACSFLFEEVTEETLDRLTAEQLMLVESWIENGGSSTMSALRTLLKNDPESVQSIVEYLEDAPLYDTVQVNGTDYILVHAGLGNFDPNRSLDEYEPDDLLLVRTSLTDTFFPDATLIFGHTPTYYYGAEYEGRAIHTDTWICIDTGAAGGKSPMLLCLDTMQEYYY